LEDYRQEDHNFLRWVNKSFNISGSNVYKARLLSKGRLLVDTYTAAKELVRDTDYNLSMMAEKHLK
jgi:hypothetical protein